VESPYTLQFRVFGKHVTIVEHNETVQQCAPPDVPRTQVSTGVNAKILSRRVNMRIAISGTHFSGKSSLVQALSEALPQYTTVEEPYHLLQEEGYEFAELPSIEDFELQLERAIENLDETLPNVIFDRCPADILGYLLSHADAEVFNLEEWLPRVQTAIKKLDLVVFLPIEEPDRIVLPRSQDAAYRQRVDEKLREVILDDIFDFEVDVLEVSGNPKTRVERVLAHIANESA
jgi:predicted ATPase